MSSSITPSLKYIEFDSTYRDRKLYPDPSSFIVNVSQSTQGDRFTAKDPVCFSSPILVFDYTFIEPPAPFFNGNSITGITVSNTTLPLF